MARNTTKDIDAEYESLLQQEIYESCEQSLYVYLTNAWKYIEPYEFVECWHTEAIADHVQACINGEIPRLLINVPPRFGKSTTISVAAPTWCWGPRNLPQTKFLTASYAQPLSTRDSLRSRRLIQQSWYQTAWGKNFALTFDQNVKTRYDNDKYGERISTSVGGLGTGEGYDILIIDDPLNARHASSDARLSEVIEWWRGTISTRKNDVKTAREMIIMQRIDEKDLVGHILAEENDAGEWCHLCLPMEWERRYWTSPIGWSDPRTTEGELLAPNRYDYEAVRKLEKSLGPYKAAAQLQQRPAPQGGGTIKENWFRYYATMPSFEMIIQSWDVTFDDTDGADYTVGQVWGRIGGDRYLLDQRREKMDINTQCKAIIEMYKKWGGTRAILIENKANGMAINKLLKNPDQIKLHNCQVPGIILVDPKEYGGDKRSRLLNCVAEFSAGNVYFPVDTIAPWVTITKKELTMFPKAAHDDCVDAVTYALGYFAKSGSNLTTDNHKIIELSKHEERQRLKLLESSRGFSEKSTRREARNLW